MAGFEPSTQFDPKGDLGSATAVEVDGSSTTVGSRDPPRGSRPAESAARKLRGRIDMKQDLVMPNYLRTANPKAAEPAFP